jgi:NAD(P)-dependent dehydrogenase (short-subunit alcohol dehydrogenase family)
MAGEPDKRAANLAVLSGDAKLAFERRLALARARVIWHVLAMQPSELSNSSLFAGKVVVVTGAGNGIGREEALAFARAGASVVVNDLGGARDGEGSAQQVAQQVAEEIRAAGGAAVASTDSVATVEGAQAILWTAIAKFGRVDVLVNNAGILRDKTIVNMSETDFDRVVEVHLRGTWLLTRAFARCVRQQGPGRYAIVNTTSRSGLIGNFGQANYAAAKAGIFGLTRVAAIELAKLGIRVNAIAPVAQTRMTQELVRLQEQGLAELAPEHVANVVLWLASELSPEVTGRIFGVHGPAVFEYAMEQSPQVLPAASAPAWTPQTLATHLTTFGFANVGEN